MEDNSRTLADWRAMTPEERRQTLHAELTKVHIVEVKLIAVDEYTDAKKRADFKCPRGWNQIGCEGYVCPRQPDPCDRCPTWVEIKKIRKEGVIPEGEWKELVKPCQTCEKKVDWMEEPTHYEVCREAKKARYLVNNVLQGEVVVSSNHTQDGWVIPV